MKKMKECLNTVSELQSKYVDLNDFKRHCCLDIEKTYPLTSIQKLAAKKVSYPSTSATMS